MNTKPLIGLLAGLGTGLALGMLFAPKSGKETLADLSDTLNGFGGQLRESWQALTGAVEESAESLIAELEERREDLVAADFNRPEDLPHRPHFEMPSE